MNINQLDNELEIHLNRLGYKWYIYKNILKKRKIVGECWIWIEAKRNTYGAIKINGRVIDIHRFIVHLFYGMPLYGGEFLACHRLEFKSRLCFNPNHLYKGSCYTNMKDCVSAGTHNMLRKNRK